MTKKIKILQILPNLSRGGAEKVSTDLLLKLNSNDFNLSLILFKDNNEGGELKQSLISKGINIISLKKNFLIDPINFWNIYCQIKKIKPDIIHTHLGGDIYGRLAGALAKVPIIISTEHNLNFKERKSAAWLKKISIKYATKIIAVSEAVKKDAKKRYNIPDDKLMVIYNGIDLSYFQKTNSAQKPNNGMLCLGTMGRLTEQKGFMTLINAISKTKNYNYILNIAGAGELETALKQSVKELNLEKRINFSGIVEAREFLNNIDAFVFPSLWEGLGLAVIEAAALSKPIIASNADGINEIIGADDGLLFKAGDENDLAAKIDYLIENIHTEEIKVKIIKARTKVSNQFDLNKMVIAYEAEYKSLFEKICASCK
jgi:glycosyltransferase involved in cell wall biosynthesis